jgi:hypothetical protein
MAERQQHLAELAVGIDVFRLNGKHRAMLDDRFLRSAEHVQRSAEAVASGDVGGVGRKHALELLDGFLGQFQIYERIAKGDARFGIVGRSAKADSKYRAASCWRLSPAMTLPRFLCAST